MRKAFLCFALIAALALTCIPLATTPTVSATSATSSLVSQSSLGQPIAPNVYIENKTRTPDLNTTVVPNQTESWSTIQYFVFQSNIYRVMTVGNGVWNDTDYLYTYWVRLISDPDGSLNSSTPKFSGDEVGVWTWFVFENGTFHWTLMNKTFTWYEYDNVSSSWNPMTASAFSTLNSSIKSAYSGALPTAAGKVYKAYLHEMLTLTNNITKPQPTVTTKYGYFSYWVDMSFLPRIEKNPLSYTFNAFTSKDRLIAFVAYNDTDHNGIMNVGVTKAGPNVVSLTSTEADYIFQAVEAGAVTFIPVHTETQTGYSEAEGWGFSLSNLTGVMEPVGEQTAFNTTISSVQFNFHFMRNSTSALVKVDEILGQFGTSPTNATIPSQLNGLSLAILYYSYFEGLSISKYPTTPITAAGEAVDSEGNSTNTSALSFSSSGKNLVTIVIGGNTYTWNGTQTETANSETIPWNAFQASFTAVGNQSIVQVNFSVERSLYAVCFPQWSGESITHDPYFAVFTYGAPTQSSLPSSLILIGVAVGVVAAVAVVVVVRRRRAA